MAPQRKDKLFQVNDAICVSLGVSRFFFTDEASFLLRHYIAALINYVGNKPVRQQAKSMFALFFVMNLLSTLTPSHSASNNAVLVTDGVLRHHNDASCATGKIFLTGKWTQILY